MRQAARSVTTCDHLGERQFRPLGASLSVGVESVVVLKQAGEGGEGDHRPSGMRTEVPIPGRATRAV